MLQAIAPLLHRAIDARQTREAVFGQGTMALSVLDHLPRPIVVVDEQGRAVYANTASEAGEAKVAGFALSGGLGRRTVQVGHPGDTERLLAAIGRVVRGRAPMEDVAVRGRAGAPYSIRVIRFRTEKHALAPARHAVLFVQLPSVPPVSVPALLQSLFGLSIKESSLAIAMAEGISPRAYAEQHAVSYETVRAQLKAIYGKVGVARQAELVRAVLGLGR